MQVPNAFPSYSVKSIERAHEFYENVLGLKVKEIPMGTGKLLELELPEMRVLLYEKSDHRPATFTVLNFQVDDIENVVTELTKKGVNFEHYDGMNKLGILENQKDGPTIAWFKDPDGNFLSIIQNGPEKSAEYRGEAPPSPS